MPAAPEADAAAFAHWARAQGRRLGRADADGSGGLQALQAIIGDARVVSFGEGLHGAAEPLDFRNRMFRFLVDQLGFEAIVLESGWAEGLIVDRYVQDGSGDFDEVMAQGFTAGFGAMPQNAELVRWMRAANAQPGRRRRLHFYGMDVSGGDQTGMGGALQQALQALAGRRPDQAAALQARIGDLLPAIRLDRFAAEPMAYTTLNQAERDRLTGAVADLVAAIAIDEPEWNASGHTPEHGLALQLAVSARQADDYLRQAPIGWGAAQGMAGLMGCVAAADRAKADNIEWVRRRLGPDSRILLFAHRDHLAGARSTIRWPGRFESLALPPMVGETLHPRYGRELVTIAHLFGAEHLHPGKPPTQALPGSIEAALAQDDGGVQLLDLRAAPAEVRAWLAQPRELFGVPPFNTTQAARAWDAIWFTPQVGPAA